MKFHLIIYSAFLLLINISLAQHLPHKIDNQWHYNWLVSGPDYAAVASERETINGVEYWKINRYAALTGELIETVYDRMEGDSLYIRKVACPEELIINFNWPLGHIEVTALGNDCYSFKKVAAIFNRNVFGINTTSYVLQYGQHCPGYDTAWTLFTPEINKELGSYFTYDGHLVGAVINGVTYGTLHPLPVELISFDAVFNDNFVELKWSTASETNNAGYEIQRKIYEDYEWENIAFIEGKGTTAQQQIYNYLDKEIYDGTWFYRIKQIDYDGTAKLIGETPVDVKMLPEEIMLHQNFPNPFNPETNISYSIPESDNVSLKIYDVLGKETLTLINDKQEKGSYTIKFDAQTLPSGVYFYKLTTGNYSITKKMMLAK